MLIKVYGAALIGIDATLITMEMNSTRGCMFYLVGLPDAAVKESYRASSPPANQRVAHSSDKSGHQHGTGRHPQGRFGL